MNVLTRQRIDDVLDAADLDESIIYREYLGRGMFGERCFGIIGSSRDAFMFIGAYAYVIGQEDEDPQQIFDLADAVMSDNLGKDMIFYFPGWTIEDGAASKNRGM